jgi:pilus assembly protein CpaF
LEEGFCSKEILALLMNCVESHMNLTFCGMPGIGKTECVKFFSQFIPANERVITIEDTLEIRYSKTNPGKDCVELKVSEDTFGYADAIKSSLRLNPKWIMLSEARSKEVKYLLESWSTGVRGMTTLHTDDVRNVPDRILNMLENRSDADRMENDIFQALDVGVLVRKKTDADGMKRRYIDQLCFYVRDKGVNKVEMVVFDGKCIVKELSDNVMQLFERSGISNPFISPVLEQMLGGEA